MDLINKNMQQEENNFIPEEEIIKPTKNWKELIPKTRIMIYSQIAFLVLLLIFIGYYAYFFFISINRDNSSSTPTPSGAVYPTSTPILPKTKWATDSAIIQTKTDLENLKKSFKDIDLTEESLSFPGLDFNLRF